MLTVNTEPSDLACRLADSRWLQIVFGVSRAIYWMRVPMLRVELADDQRALVPN